IILFFLALFHFDAVYATDPGDTSITYLKIAELEYKDGQLFLIQPLRPAIDGNDAEWKEHKIALPPRQAEDFLSFIEELDLLAMQPNEKERVGESPFRLSFARHHQIREISA